MRRSLYVQSSSPLTPAPQPLEVNDALCVLCGPLRSLRSNQPDPSPADSATPASSLPFPPGSWAVAVSGGADSVALLLLLKEDQNLSLRVVHLDHQLRGPQSAADARFVADLSARLNIPCDIARRRDLESTLGRLPANPSAKYRVIRRALFKRIVRQHGLDGVILAHHADDLAETVLHRLIRGPSLTALAPLRADTIIDNLRILRPLLDLTRDDLRTFLNSRRQNWREDPSNASDDYLRNRLRKILTAHPNLKPTLIDLAHSAAALSDWIATTAPRLPPQFAANALAQLAPILARHSARLWLTDAGSPPEKLSTSVLDRLIAMSADAATPAHQTFPGKLSVHRRAGKISATATA